MTSPGPPGAGEHARRGAARDRAMDAVDQVLAAEVSWVLPKSPELARDAVRSLDHVRAVLAEQRPAITAGQVRDAIDALLRRSGFILPHWSNQVASLPADGWSCAHAQALAFDLAEIARAGGLIRDLIAAVSLPRGAPASPGSPAPTSHRRRPDASGARKPAVRAATVDAARSPAGAVTRLPPGSRRQLLQASAIIPAGLAVATVCYLAWDRHPAPPPGRTGAVSAARTAVRATAQTGSRAASCGSPAARASATATGAAVTSLQIQLLGASSANPRAEAVFYLDTASPAPLEVQITYRGTAEACPVIDAEHLSGHTAYQFALPIETAPYCGGGVVVSATAGVFTASQTTSAAPCAGPASPRQSRSKT